MFTAAYKNMVFYGETQEDADRMKKRMQEMERKQREDNLLAFAYLDKGNLATFRRMMEMAK